MNTTACFTAYLCNKNISHVTHLTGLAENTPQKRQGQLSLGSAPSGAVGLAANPTERGGDDPGCRSRRRPGPAARVVLNGQLRRAGAAAALPPRTAAGRRPSPGREWGASAVAQA